MIHVEVQAGESDFLFSPNHLFAMYWFRIIYDASADLRVDFAWKPRFGDSPPSDLSAPGHSISKPRPGRAVKAD
jgi:hypothetical protein